MTVRAILRAYGLWLLGVLSAAAAAFFLYRSRLISYELEGEASAVDLDTVEQYTGAGAGELELD